MSVRCYSKQAKAFLAAIGGPGAIGGLDAGRITAFMVDHCRDRNTWSLDVRAVDSLYKPAKALRNVPATVAIFLA